jgi:hypothetical protein
MQYLHSKLVCLHLWEIKKIRYSRFKNKIKEVLLCR